MKVIVMTCGADKPRVFSNLDIAYDSLRTKEAFFTKDTFPTKKELLELEKEAEELNEDFLFFNESRPKGCFATVQLTSAVIDQ